MLLYLHDPVPKKFAVPGPDLQGLESATIEYPGKTSDALYRVLGATRKGSLNDRFKQDGIALDAVPRI